MDSFKVLKFYDKPSHDEIEKISKLFSDDPAYYKATDKIFIFAFQIEYLCDHKEDIDSYIQDFYYLVMSNLKFEQIIQSQAEFGITRINDLSFQFYSNENVSFDFSKYLKEIIANKDYSSFNKLLTNYKILINDFSFTIDNVECFIDQYGNVLTSRITKQLIKLCAWLLMGDVVNE